MDLRSLRVRRTVVAYLALAVAACSGPAVPTRQNSQATTALPKIANANIGGYLLEYECAGTGSPTVILEAAGCPGMLMDDPPGPTCQRRCVSRPDRR